MITLLRTSFLILVSNVVITSSMCQLYCNVYIFIFSLEKYNQNCDAYDS